MRWEGAKLRGRVPEELEQVACLHGMRHHEWDRRDTVMCRFLIVTGRPGRDLSLKCWFHPVIQMYIRTGKQAGSAPPTQAKAGSRSPLEKFVGAISCHHRSCHQVEIISADGGSIFNNLIRVPSRGLQRQRYPFL